MSCRNRLIESKRLTFHALGAAIACMVAIACGGGGGSPNSPGNSGGNTPPAASCRTVAASSRSVQTFADGQVVTSDTTCSAAASDVTCNSTFTDSVFGSGTVAQTTRFASRGDIVDEAAANPPLSRSLSTTTVTTSSGVSFTTTATNSYDAQKRLTSTAVVSQLPQLTTTTTFSAWDASGRPTAGTTTLSPGPSFPVSITYDNANRSVTRNMGPNICTVTHDTNGIIIREVCTGTTPSTTNVTVNSTQQVCR